MLGQSTAQPYVSISAFDFRLDFSAHLQSLGDAGFPDRVSFPQAVVVGGIGEGQRQYTKIHRVLPMACAETLRDCELIVQQLKLSRLFSTNLFGRLRLRHPHSSAGGREVLSRGYSPAPSAAARRHRLLVGHLVAVAPPLPCAVSLWSPQTAQVRHVSRRHRA